MLVVVAILAILITGATGTYRTYIDQVRFNKARATLSYIISQSEVFKANTGFFLPNLEEMNVSFSGLLDYAYFINCLEGDGTNILSGDEFAGTDPDSEWSSGTKTCGSFTDTNPDPDTDCSDCSSATPTQWMGTVLAYSYCHIDQENCVSPSPPIITTADNTLYCDINVRNSLQILNLCQEKQDDASFDSGNDQKKKRDSKFRIKGSYGMCDVNHLIEGKQLRGTDKSCAHSKEYVPVIRNPLIVKPDGSSLGAGDTAYFSRPNYLRVFALGCKRREENCSNSVDQVIIYFDTNGNMGDYLIRPPSTP